MQCLNSVTLHNKFGYKNTGVFCCCFLSALKNYQLKAEMIITAFVTMI